MRKSGVRILPGDVVRFARVGDGEGVVEEVLPRRSTLVRPYIANVDQVVLVASLAEPPPSLDLLDRLLVLTQAEGLQAFIVWNKADLVSRAEAEAYIRVYERAGFPRRSRARRPTWVVTSCLGLERPSDGSRRVGSR